MGEWLSRNSTTPDRLDIMEVMESAKKWTAADTMAHPEMQACMFVISPSYFNNLYSASRSPGSIKGTES